MSLLPGEKAVVVVNHVSRVMNGRRKNLMAWRGCGRDGYRRRKNLMVSAFLCQNRRSL